MSGPRWTGRRSSASNDLRFGGAEPALLVKGLDFGTEASIRSFVMVANRPTADKKLGLVTVTGNFEK